MSASIDEKNPFLAATLRRREELRLKIDAAADRIAQRRALAEAAGTDDTSIIDRLEQLGFTRESVKVVDLLPLVHVAWADGKIQRAERAQILSIVRERGIDAESDAGILMETLLEQRPSDSFMAQSLMLVRDLAERTGADTANVVDLCARVAEASGSLFGFGRSVSVAERSLIATVAAALGTAAEARFQSRLKG